MTWGRVPRTAEEKEFWEQCYKIGMKNGWCSGRYAMRDGNFIVEEDRLNKGSVCVIEDRKELKEFFEHGNWCLGDAIIHKQLCFIQQVNGGDEWLTIRAFDDAEPLAFESVTFERIIKRGEFPKYIERLLQATRQQCQKWSLRFLLAPRVDND